MKKTHKLYDQSKVNRDHESLKSDDAITVLTNFFNTLAENNGSLKPPKT